MAMDGLNLAASVAECRRIVGGRIDKIQQPEKDELAVNLRCGGENLRPVSYTHLRAHET